MYWLGLTMVKGIGPVRFKELLSRFGDVQAIWEAEPRLLQEAGFQQKMIESLERVRSGVDLQKCWDQLQNHQVSLLTLDEPTYPRRLKEIHQPPPALFVKGELSLQDEWAVAIVGTRKLSPYGQQVADEVARFLVRQGVTVVSGLARGVDTIAHTAALKAGGRTIAVLGSGLDRIYPQENRSLANEIIQNGALISNYPLGTPPEAGNFPPRNRIISGLSIAVVIVEAGKKSGALITANYANDQGRDVFAVPGKIYASQSAGTNQLIKEGAIPLLAPEDLMESLNLLMVTEKQTARQVLPADATEAALFGALSFEPTHIDEIGRKVSMSIDQVSASLTLMELKGMVRHVGGMQYVALKERKAHYTLTKS